MDTSTSHTVQRMLEDTEVQALHFAHPGYILYTARKSDHEESNPALVRVRIEVGRNAAPTAQVSHRPDWHDLEYLAGALDIVPAERDQVMSQYIQQIVSRCMDRHQRIQALLSFS